MQQESRISARLSGQVGPPTQLQIETDKTLPIMSQGPKVRSRSSLIPARDHEGAIQPPAHRPVPIPELCEERPAMGWLLGWEYGRKWLERRDEITQQRALISKLGRIPPDFEWWLNQRRPLLVRKQRFRKTGPRKVVTAFNVGKEFREAQNRKVLKNMEFSSMEN